MKSSIRTQSKRDDNFSSLLAVRMHPDLRKELYNHCSKNKIKISDAVRAAIFNYVKKNHKR